MRHTVSEWVYNSQRAYCKRCGNFSRSRDNVTPYCPYCGSFMLNYEDVPCTAYNSEYKRCWGTKEIESCSCGGNMQKCDFYEEVRMKGKRK